MTHSPEERPTGGMSHRTKRLLYILAGVAMFVIGTYLALHAMRSDPLKFNVGAALVVLGFLTAGYASFMQDKSDHKPRDGNGGARRQA